MNWLMLAPSVGEMPMSNSCETRSAMQLTVKCRCSILLLRQRVIIDETRTGMWGWWRWSTHSKASYSHLSSTQEQQMSGTCSMRMLICKRGWATLRMACTNDIERVRITMLTTCIKFRTRSAEGRRRERNVPQVDLLSSNQTSRLRTCPYTLLQCSCHTQCMVL